MCVWCVWSGAWRDKLERLHAPYPILPYPVLPCAPLYLPTAVKFEVPVQYTVSTHACRAAAGGSSVVAVRRAVVHVLHVHCRRLVVRQCSTYVQ